MYKNYKIFYEFRKKICLIKYIPINQKIRHMIKDKNILIFGSNSDLSHELLKKLAPENNLFLVSKNLKKLDENRDYFKNISKNKIINYCADLNDLNTSNQILDKYFLNLIL